MKTVRRSGRSRSRTIPLPCAAAVAAARARCPSAGAGRQCSPIRDAPRRSRSRVASPQQPAQCQRCVTWCRCRRRRARPTPRPPIAASSRNIRRARQPSATIRRADLGAKGVFFRAMVGPFATANRRPALHQPEARPAAIALCSRTERRCLDPLRGAANPRRWRHAFITDLAGLTLTADERAFLREADPWGLILFKRNIDKTCTSCSRSSRACAKLSGATAPVLVDQEGGRVQRLGPPHWPAYPPGAAYGRDLRPRPAGRACGGAARRPADRGRSARGSASTSIACRSPTCRSAAPTR